MANTDTDLEISLFKRICDNFSVEEIPILGKVIERFR